MEITLEAIISLVGLLFGGGTIGGFITYKYARKKAAAEAQKAEAEAKQAEAEAAEAKQNYYQQMMEDISKDRDYYKQERDELRDKLDTLTRSVMEWKRISEEERLTMKRDISRLGRQLSCLRSLICGREDCALRVPVSIEGESIPKKQKAKKDKNDIEPLASDEL